MISFPYEKNTSELEKAVCEKNLEKIRALVRQGEDINQTTPWNNETLLHKTSSVEVAKEILLCGANVNKTNKYGDTPLIIAITQYKSLDVVKVLLKYGADVNATNRKGNTALNHIVKQGRQELDIVKELLFCGADINIRNRERRLYEDHNTPLDNAMSYLECAKLLIKITLLKHFDRGYKNIIDLTPYRDFSRFNEASHYLDDCVCEIVRMKTEKFNDKLSLYQFINLKSASLKTLHEANKVTDLETDYAIYHDIISDRVKWCLEKTSLLNKLHGIQIYCSNKKVILNFDCACNIAKYLCNEDLLNLITAFYKDAGQVLHSSESLKRLIQQQDIKAEDEPSCSYGKRAKLESSGNE